MKHTKRMLLGVFCFIFAFYFQLNAQQRDGNTVVIEKYFQNSGASKVQNSIKNRVVQSNSLANTLTQIGNYNYSYIQTGNNKGTQNVTQQGNKNNVVLLSYYGGNSYTNLVSEQIGNNNSIQIIGNNSITEKLKITQKANNSTIFIRNYN